MTAARRTQLARLGIWIGLATVAVLTAVLTARTETGLRRIANLLSPEASEGVRSAKIAGPQIASRQVDQEVERRLNEAVRALAADRDRLASRVAALERNLDDVTGSISHSSAPNSASALAAQAPRPLPQSQAAPAPNPPLVPPPGPQASAPAAAAPAQPAQSAPQAAAPPTVQAAPNRVAAGHLATGVPTAADSVATKTEFGIDVGSNASVEGLRALWTTLKTSQPALFDGLRPVVAVRESQKPGTIELHLIAGPIANAGMAARMCAALAAMNQTCQPAVFDGQRLALQ
jgi:hypothetical protein